VVCLMTAMLLQTSERGSDVKMAKSPSVARLLCAVVIFGSSVKVSALALGKVLRD
jgi:hypothetical protein